MSARSLHQPPGRQRVNSSYGRARGVVPGYLIRPNPPKKVQPVLIIAEVDPYAQPVRQTTNIGESSCQACSNLCKSSTSEFEMFIVKKIS